MLNYFTHMPNILSLNLENCFEKGLNMLSPHLDGKQHSFKKYLIFLKKTIKGREKS